MITEYEHGCRDARAEMLEKLIEFIEDTFEHDDIASALSEDIKIEIDRERLDAN